MKISARGQNTSQDFQEKKERITKLQRIIREKGFLRKDRELFRNRVYVYIVMHNIKI